MFKFGTERERPLFNEYGIFFSLYVFHKSGSHLYIFFIESLFKMMKKAFYFILKALFGLRIFKFFSRLIGHVEKKHDQKYKVNFKIYGVRTWLTNNCNIHIAQYLTK